MPRTAPDPVFPVPAPRRLVRYAISDTSLSRLGGEDYLKALLDTSADLVQWREPSIARDRQLRWLRRVTAPTRAGGPLLVINSDLELAVEAGAAGVHYKAGQDGDYDRARTSGLLVGRSVHSFEEGRSACGAGCDYVLLSPLFAPRSKGSSLPPLGLARAREIAEALPVPVLALGGVCRDHFESLRQWRVLAGLAGISWVHDELAARRRRRPPVGPL